MYYLQHNPYMYTDIDNVCRYIISDTKYAWAFNEDLTKLRAKRNIHVLKKIG